MLFTFRKLDYQLIPSFHTALKRLHISGVHVTGSGKNTLRKFAVDSSHLNLVVG